MRCHTFIRTSMSLLALSSALAASADTVKLVDFTIPGPAGLNVVASHIGASWYGPAGQFTALLNGASFVTYCVELPQFADFGVSYSNYSPVSGVAAFGAEKAQDLARLVSYVGMSPQYATDSAMMQAAIWEVVHESGRHYSFTSGDVLASGLDGATQDWLDAFDWTAMKSTTPIYDVSVLSSVSNQDFLLTTPIPEPSTYALMALGIGLVGLASRKRKPAAVAA